MDIKKFVRLNDKGELEFDESGFQSGLDAEISRAVDKYAKGKGKDEIRKQLEEEAKLYAEEKLKAEKEEFEKYKQSETVKIIRAKAQAKLDNKGFSEKEVEFILNTVNSDEEQSLKNVDTLVEERTKFLADTQRKQSKIFKNSNNNLLIQIRCLFLTQMKELSQFKELRLIY